MRPRRPMRSYFCIKAEKIVERILPSSLLLDPNGADVVVSLDSSRYVRILPDCSRDAFSFQDGSFSPDSLVDFSYGSFQIDLPGFLDEGLQDSPRDRCRVFSRSYYPRPCASRIDLNTPIVSRILLGSLDSVPTRGYRAPPPCGSSPHFIIVHS